jgi:hypothetical protein
MRWCCCWLGKAVDARIDAHDGSEEAVDAKGVAGACLVALSGGSPKRREAPVAL